VIRADLHLHTIYSPDCDMKLSDIIQRCSSVGINCVAITDHNTIRGALKLKEICPFKVIVGEEIRTRKGEIVGLFLSQEVEPGLDLAETVRRIKEQGGLVSIPHPFDRFHLSALKDMDEDLLRAVDMIEVFNARAAYFAHPQRAVKVAQDYGICPCAGSDAHTLGEIGNAYIEMEDFEDEKDFLVALSQGRIEGKKTSPLVHMITSLVKIKKKLGWGRI
jgi:hypothetical protein